MYIGKLKHLNCEVHLTKLTILVTAIKVKSKFFQLNRFHDLRKWPQKKKVAQIELYHTLTLIFSQPQKVVKKYF